MDIERAIEQLPRGYKAVFVLHDVEGYEHHEIAAMQGSSLGTSKSQLHKARTRLQRLLRTATHKKERPTPEDAEPVLETTCAGR
jgi:RNA polymerase sigma-70 factor (ECF subfamily)